MAVLTPGIAKLTVRSARWPDDTAQLAALDTSFTTDRIYRVHRGDLSFELIEEIVDPPIHKSYGSLREDGDRLRQMGHVVVAEQGTRLVGMAAADFSSWNRRVQVEDFFVAPAARGRGIGRALMDSVVAYARHVEARCIWLETQPVNYAAVQFYRQMGFRLCGFDERLYDPATLGTEEVALFFALDLSS
jgi:ribosomal protein S18 acetylase RimI-like enzyme